MRKLARQLVGFIEKGLPKARKFAQQPDMIYTVVPDISREQGKAKIPWPNVDAQSGVIQWHSGVKEYDFYTVLFGIGRALGVAANLIWDRALVYPLERPKFVATAMPEDMAAGKEVIIED